VSGPIVEGDFVSSVRKCEHGVFKPGDSWSAPNRSCSICRSQMPELFRPPTIKKAVKQKRKSIAVEVELEVTESEKDLRPEISNEEMYEECER
jgi:hypothetical protein